MSLIYAYKDRNYTRDFTILDGNDDTITPGTHDTIRVIIGHEGGAIQLTVTSAAPTANGSSFTKGEKNRLRLDAQDLDFEAGTYTLFFDYLDNADDAEWKNVSRQVVVLEDT